MAKHQKGSVAIAGYYGFGNAGDELILASLVQHYRKEKPAASITVFSAHPQATAAHFGVKAVNRWLPWQWIRPLWTAETFVLGGGGLLQETTGPWNYFYYLLLVMLAKLLGCRTEARALGLDPVDQWWNRIWTRFVFNNLIDYVSVRDTESQRALETVGVFARMWRVPDPVFQLERPKIETAARESTRIAWAVCDWDQRPGWEHDLAFLLDRVHRQLGATNELVPFFPAQDEALARKVGELTTQPCTVRIWTQPEDLVGWAQEYGLVIGMRYHALALAALAEKPFIGWGNQRKVRTLCRDFNQPMWTFERGWDVESVFRQIAETWRQRNTNPERYRTQIEQWRNAPAVASESARIYVATV